MYNRNRIGLYTLILSVAFITFGVLRGEVKTVLVKAINICLECVGIG
ncbi:MAG: hypothetical protein GX987_01865 [Tissierellia bacterium]|nr:hypothetical protein [Tissierellia bacterium]